MNSQIAYTWIKTRNINEFHPHVQSYGFCFNEEGKLLVLSDNGTAKIPGGTPEKDETSLQTLERELQEEANITISKFLPLGVQKVEHPNNSNLKEGDLFYQHRYVCLIDKINNQDPDPDNGKLYERKFLTLEESLDFIKWGEVGNQMIKDAFQEFSELEHLKVF